ncbi:(2Fe-2S)-binding protein [Actinoplanes sp. NPDC049681]|uniref:(2Fe-2S)-binding protein n=1 Tax=Actinoplanes sp. NPDC049681 TaxID=3363905 RepID=UPI0037ADFF95
MNDHAIDADVEPRALLVDYLREDLGLTGAKVGCDTGQCGSCTVLVDGRAVKSCAMLAVQADGADVTTIEGANPATGLSDLQEALWKEHGVQCGFCTPGMVLTLQQLLADDKAPTEAKVRRELAGNLCRCTGYQSVVRAVLSLVGRDCGPGDE